MGTTPEPDRPAPDLQATGERIDALLDASSAGGVKGRERAEELLRLVTDVYGAGLERFMDLLHETGRLDDDLLALLAEDDLVSSLLLVHGLHPYGVEQRVEQALESVRPYLGSHGGDVELLGVDAGGVVSLRLLGSCDGCPSSSVTLKLAVEDAIESAAPEIVAIEVEEAAGADNGAGAGGPLIPVDSLRSRLDSSGSGDEAGGAWHELSVPADLAAGGTATTTVGDTRLLLCRVGTDVLVFRDRCARCEEGLGDAVLARRLGGKADDALLRCPTCGAHYDVRRAGACLDAPDLHLDPLPLLTDGPTVSVAVPAPVA
jgi:Fe-S cluster biogenesis protein NfuA/nitrite reductase/ring-hydroxylating ferredoxin subunit